MDSNNPLILKTRMNPKIFDRNKSNHDKAWNSNLTSTNTIKSKVVKENENENTLLGPYELKITLEPLLETQHHQQTAIIANESKKIKKKPIIVTATSSKDLENQISLLEHQHRDEHQRHEIFIKKLNDGWIQNVPWLALIISLMQICIFIFATEGVYQTLMYTPYKRYQVWRFLTYTFLHSDKIHLMINIALQFLTAFFLEIEQGHLKVLFIYTLGGISGSLGTSIFQPKLLMVGSSACVYSLLMSHVPHLIMNFRILPYRYFRIIAVMILCASDIGFSIYHCLIHFNQKPQISLAAHLSGASAGFLLAFIIYSRMEYKIFKVLQYLSMSIFCSFLIFAIFFNFNCKQSSQNRFKCFL